MTIGDTLRWLTGESRRGRTPWLWLAPNPLYWACLDLRYRLRRRRRRRTRRRLAATAARIDAIVQLLGWMRGGVRSTATFWASGRRCDGWRLALVEVDAPADLVANQRLGLE